MHNNSSRKQSSCQVIDHIKFIAKDLFQEDIRQNTLQKYTYLPTKYKTYADHSQHELLYDPKQCVDRFNNRMNHDVAEPKKIVTFQDVEKLIQTHKNKKNKQHIPITNKINQNVYGKFKRQSTQIREAMHASKNRQQKQIIEQTWNDFLKRESQRYQDRKRLYMHIRLAEQGYRKSLSRGRRTKTQYNSNPKTVESRYVNEVQLGIDKLRQDAEALKLKIFKLVKKDTKRSGSKDGLVKTFQRWNYKK